MLFIDDHQAQAIEFDFFFDQGVSADDQLSLAAIDEAAGGALAVVIERTGEQDDAIAARACRATMVLPDPTSPCSNRRMGLGERMSVTISPRVRFCAAVG
jgi:hypothetical protein